MASSSTSYRIHLLGSNLACLESVEFFAVHVFVLFLVVWRVHFANLIITKYVQINCQWDHPEKQMCSEQLTHIILGMRRLLCCRCWCCQRLIYGADSPRENSGLGPSNPQQQKSGYARELGHRGLCQQHLSYLVFECSKQIAKKKYGDHGRPWQVDNTCREGKNQICAKWSCAAISQGKLLWLFIMFLSTYGLCCHPNSEIK